MKPRPALPLIPFALLACAGPVAEAPAAAAAPVIRIEVRGRAIEPGGIVRVLVEVEPRDAAVEGSFLDAPLHFVADGNRLAAWAAIELDRKPGDWPVEVRARTAEGGEASARLEVAIAAKEFPEQRLTVEEKYVSPPKEVESRIAAERKRLDAIYARRTPPPEALGPFVAPVPGEPTSAFGLKRFFNEKPRSPHSGLDLRAPTGTPVVAAGAGTVALAHDLYFSGKTVILDHGGGLFTIYAHLSRIDVREGDAVARGARLGLSGATGRVTGPHLHWGGRVGERIFDPRGLLDPALFASTPSR